MSVRSLRGGCKRLRFNLGEKEGQLSALGKRILLDIVVEAPRRLSDELRYAVLGALPGFSPAVIRQDITFLKILILLKQLISWRASQAVVVRASF